MNAPVLTLVPPRQTVEIGRRFTGQHRVERDAATGEYSEMLPKIEGHALALQQALLDGPRRH